MAIEARAEYRFRGKLIGSGGVFMNVLEMSVIGLHLTHQQKTCMP